MSNDKGNIRPEKGLSDCDQLVTIVGTFPHT